MTETVLYKLQNTVKNLILFISVPKIKFIVFSAAQNPGYLHVKYLNLRKRRAQVFNCPSRKTEHQPIKFTFRVGNATVDMVNGEINIDKV